MPSLGPRLNSASPWSRSASPAGRVVPSGPSTRPMPASGPERVRQLGDLAGGPGARLGHRRHDAVVEEIGEPLAEPVRHGGVTGEEGQQPDRHDRPGVGPAQPRRAAGGPGQQQVALVGTLLLLGQPDRGQCPHAGVDAVHRLPVAAPAGPARSAAAPPRAGRARRRRARPSATALIRPRSGSPIWVITSAGIVSGTGASCRRPAPRPGAGWPGRRRCRGWRARGARAGSARRRAPGPGAGR